MFKNTSPNELLYKSLECLNLCHLIQFDHDNKPISFSEEELAILKFTKKGNFFFEQIESVKEDNHVNNYFILNINGELKRYQCLEIIEFTSSRKRMSIIVKDEKNEIYMFTKGADDILKDYLKKEFEHDFKKLN